jgi:hypothetical protein
MSETDVRTYSGLRVLPAALALLDVEHDPVARAAVTVEPVERRGRSGSWTEDEVTIDWTRLTNPQRSSTAIRLPTFARSMRDGTPVDMREIDHFGHGTFAHFMRALAVAWPDPPPPIEEMQRQGWRELSGEEFRRRARDDDPDEPGGRDRRPTGRRRRGRRRGPAVARGGRGGGWAQRSRRRRRGVAFMGAGEVVG